MFLFSFFLSNISLLTLSSLCSSLNREKTNNFIYTYTILTTSEQSADCRNGTGTAQGRRRWEEPEKGLTGVDGKAR